MTVAVRHLSDNVGLSWKQRVYWAQIWGGLTPMRTGGRREGSNLWEEGASGRTEMARTLSSRSGRLYRQAGVIGMLAVCENITVCVFLYVYVFLNV